MITTPGFTAERALDRPSAWYEGVGTAEHAGPDAKVVPAFHCHLETHTPDPAHGYPECYGHQWFGHDCLYVYCD